VTDILLPLPTLNPPMNANSSNPDNDHLIQSVYVSLTNPTIINIWAGRLADGNIRIYVFLINRIFNKQRDSNTMALA
jgi:hypothetical protein